jgi:predicted dehydrogenase
MNQLADKVKVGVIGAGRLANKMHYPTLHEMPDVVLTAVCDLDERKREETAALYDIPHRFGDVREMFEGVDLDAVYIVTPPQSVFPLATEAFSRGKHVFMEKPPGMNAEETRRMAELAEANGCHSQVGFNRRFCPVLRAGREEALKRGAIESCAAAYNKNSKGKAPEWNSGDWLLIDGLHAIDTLIYLAASPVKKVTPFSHRGPGGHLIRYAALMEFANGCVGTYTGNYNGGARWERFEVHAPGISSYIAAPGKTEVYTGPKPVAFTDMELTGSRDPRISYGYVQESQHFVDVILGRREPEVTLRDAVGVMEIVEQIRKYGESGGELGGKSDNGSDGGLGDE